MAVDAELQEAINSAAEKITGKSVEELTSVTKSEQDQETSTESAAEEEAEETVQTDDLTKEEADEAVRLYKLLKNPTDAVAVTAALAHKYGLLQDRPLETKTEVKEAKKDIQEIFEEALGPQYKFLAPNMSKAIDQILVQEREKQQAAISEVQQHQILGEVDKTLATLAKETAGASRQVEQKMADLMKEYPIGDNGNIDKYIRDMYALATSGRQKGVVKQQVSEKIRRNANDVGDRIGARTGAPGIETLPGKKLGLKGSVEFALKQLEAKGKK